MSALGKLEKKLNPLSKYDPLSAANLTGQNKKPKAPGVGVPPPVAPMSMFSGTIQASRTDALRRAGRRRGFGSSVRAGETNSGSSYSSSAGVRSLMGLS